MGCFHRLGKLLCLASFMKCHIWKILPVVYSRLLMISCFMNLLQYVYSPVEFTCWVSTLGQLQIRLLWTFVFKYFCEHVFISLEYILAVGLLGQMVSTYISHKKLPNPSPESGLSVSCCHQPCVRVSGVPHPCQHVCHLTLAIQHLVLWWFMVV